MSADIATSTLAGPEGDCVAFTDQVIAFLEAAGRAYETDPFSSREQFSYWLNGENGPMRVCLCIKPDSDQFALHAYSPVTIEPEHRASLLDIFATANFSCSPVKLELNPETGTVRCGFGSVLVPELLEPVRLRQMEHDATVLLNHVTPVLAMHGRTPEVGAWGHSGEEHQDRSRTLRVMICDRN